MRIGPQILWPHARAVVEREVGGGMYELVYVEKVRRPQDMSVEQFRKIAERSIAVMKQLCTAYSLPYCSVEPIAVSDDEAVLRVVMRGRRENIDGFVASEFLPTSYFARITLGDMINALVALALMAATQG